MTQEKALRVPLHLPARPLSLTKLFFHLLSSFHPLVGPTAELCPRFQGCFKARALIASPVPENTPRQVRLPHLQILANQSQAQLFL